MTVVWHGVTSERDVPGDLSRGLRSRPIVGYRAWRIRIETRVGASWEPILSSLTAGADWPKADFVASCDPRLGRRRHDAGARLPLIDCSCGIYAAKTRSAINGFGHAMVAIGRVLLSGRVIEGRRGFRAERARIAGPLAVTLGCVHARCDEIAVFAVRGSGGMRPVCPFHLVAEPRVERVVTLGEFARALCARLEVRYGVEAVTSCDQEAAQWT